MHGGKRLKNSGTSSQQTILWSVVILAASAGWKSCYAQEWKLESSISQTMLYSDNLLLSRDQEISSFGSLTTPRLHLERNSPTSEINLDARFEFAEYFDHSDFNSQDQFFDLDANQALSERSALSLTGNFTRDTTLKSEQDVTGRFLDDSFRFTSWYLQPA